MSPVTCVSVSLVAYVLGGDEYKLFKHRCVYARSALTSLSLSLSLSLSHTHTHTHTHRRGFDHLHAYRWRAAVP